MVNNKIFASLTKRVREFDQIRGLSISINYDNTHYNDKYKYNTKKNM